MLLPCPTLASTSCWYWRSGQRRIISRFDQELRHRLDLELADGSRVFTEGIVLNATWNFGDSAQAVCCYFYVLGNLLVDVVFSHDFIFGLYIFSMFNHFMIDLDLMTGLSEFYDVRLISKYSQELARLDKESINNSKLPTYYIDSSRRNRIAALILHWYCAPPTLATLRGFFATESETPQ
jgi:hypothetical protein